MHARADDRQSRRGSSSTRSHPTSTATPQQEYGDEAPQSRSWGQVAREYGAACVMGAGQSLVFGGRPHSAREAAVNAAIGCATGVGMKAVEDASGALAGR